VNVRHVVLGDTRGAGLRDRISLGDHGPAVDQQPPEMGQGDLVPVGRRDGHRQAVRRDRACERHAARGGGPNRACGAERDVDATVLAAGIGIAADREASEHVPVRRPTPGRGNGNDDEHRQRDQERRAEPNCCHSSQRVDQRSVHGDPLSNALTASRGRAHSAARPSGARRRRRPRAATRRPRRARRQRSVQRFLPEPPRSRLSGRARG
jgi:hypothetical protein